METNVEKSYYKEMIPLLVEKYKSVVEQCLQILGQEIDATLSDDKLHNVLKAKRMASEDVKYYAKQIDLIKKELNTITEVEDLVNEKLKDKVLKGAERFARE